MQPKIDLLFKIKYLKVNEVFFLVERHKHLKSFTVGSKLAYFETILLREMRSKTSLLTSVEKANSTPPKSEVFISMFFYKMLRCF